MLKSLLKINKKFSKTVATALEPIGLFVFFKRESVYQLPPNGRQVTVRLSGYTTYTKCIYASQLRTTGLRET